MQSLENGWNPPNGYRIVLVDEIDENDKWQQVYRLCDIHTINGVVVSWGPIEFIRGATREEVIEKMHAMVKDATENETVDKRV